MAYLETRIAESVPDVNYDTGGRTRVSQLTTLIDAKTLDLDDSNTWDIKGTGSTSFSNNSLSMSVTAGQYVIRQTKQVAPYFSGKAQSIEPTYQNFGLQAGVIKRYGYFSSSTAAPYTANYDGIYVESNGDDNTFYLVVVNDGTEKLRKPWTEWDGYSEISGLNWDFFNVTLIDFLWLGGAALRLFIKHPSGGFTLAHTFNYAGSASGVFIRNPQLPVRYEIRSTTGSGSFVSICSQVASEGSLGERGKSVAVYNPTGIATNAAGTIYALKWVRKTATYKGNTVKIMHYSSVITTVNARSGILMLIRNPTLSAPLTYAANSKFLEATATNQTITAGTGTVIDAITVDNNAVSMALSTSSLQELPIGIDGTAEEIVLAYMPLTSNQTIAGTISLIEQ